jgi:hypothetical protein
MILYSIKSYNAYDDDGAVIRTYDGSMPGTKWDSPQLLMDLVREARVPGTVRITIDLTI